MIRQCHSDTVADVEMYWLDFSIAAYLSLVNVYLVIYTSKALIDKIGDREKTVMKIKALGAILQVALLFFMCQMYYLVYHKNMSGRLELLLFVMRMILTELAPFAVFILAIQVEIQRIIEDDEYKPSLEVSDSDYTKATSPRVSANEDEYRKSKNWSEDSEFILHLATCDTKLVKMFTF